MSVLICAHRGASGYAPENTMKAFRLAYKLGAHACENDVHLTRDGEVVVTHDEDISRVSNGTGLVEEMTLAQLRQFDFGDGEKIPTLEECLAFFAASGMALNIEIKTSEKTYSRELTEKTGALVRKFGLESKIIISSFYHPSLRDCKLLFPELPTGVLHGEELREAGAYCASLGATYDHPYFAPLNEAYMKDCATHSIEVNPWTVNTPEDMLRMKALGCRMLITNYPDIALRT